MADEKTTVGELIAALRQFPTDMRVVVPGVESGYDDVTQAARVVIVPGRRKRNAYDGKHEDFAMTPGVPVDEKTENAVVLRYGG